MPTSSYDPPSPPALSLRIAALGAVCGLRSMLGPALVAEHASGPAKYLFRLAAPGEFIVDKLPRTPSRLAPGPLVGRALSGAGVAFVLCRRAGQSPWLGMMLGAGAALAGAWGGYHARKALGQALHIPDAVVAMGEDALAVAVGRRFA